MDDVRPEPPSFSRIDSVTLHSGKPTAAFPLLSKATPLSFEVSEGEMLYLPASWFHEVTSVSTDGYHMAFNFWLQPPTGTKFDQPYADDFWPKQWDLVVDFMEQIFNEQAFEGVSDEEEEEEAPEEEKPATKAKDNKKRKNSAGAAEERPAKKSKK